MARPSPAFSSRTQLVPPNLRPLWPARLFPPPSAPPARSQLPWLHRVLPQWARMPCPFLPRVPPHSLREISRSPLRPLHQAALNRRHPYAFRKRPTSSPLRPLPPDEDWHSTAAPATTAVNSRPAR